MRFVALRFARERSFRRERSDSRVGAMFEREERSMIRPIPLPSRALSIAVAVASAAACALPASDGTTGSSLEAAYSETDFGSQEVGTTSVARTVTLTNDHHGKTVTILHVSIAPPFFVSGPSTPYDLAPGQSVGFEVRFSPTAAGDFSSAFVASVRRDGDAVVEFTGTGVMAGCGDGICGGAEDCLACPGDCGSCEEPPDDTGTGTVVETQVGAGADDAEENAVSGVVYLDSTDLELTEDGYAGGPAQVVGLRFALPVPRNATVRTASIQFTVDETSEGPTSLMIRAEATDDAPRFTEVDGDMSGRLTTDAAVLWEPAGWTDEGAAGSAQRTPDLASVIHEIVSRPGWSDGNHVVVLVSGTGTRTAESYEGDPAAAARLRVEFAGGDPPPTCGDGVCDGGESCSGCATDCGPCSGGDDGSDPTPTYYVSNDAELTRAANNAEPGDVVALRPGVYTAGLYVNVSGTVGNRVVFMADPAAAPDSVVLRGKCVKVYGQSHVEIRGLRIEHCDGTGTNNSIGISVRGVVDRVVTDIVLSGNHTYHTYSSGIAAWGVPWGTNPGDFRRITNLVVEHNTVERGCEGGWNEIITIANGVEEFEIAHNEVLNGLDGTNGGEGIDVKEGCAYGSIHHNVVHDLARRAYYIDAAGRGAWGATPTHDVDVYNNVAYNVVNGLALMSEGGADMENIRIFNNLFYDIRDDGAFIYDHPNAADSPGIFRSIELTNNTFWNCGRQGLDLNSSHIVGAWVHNNIVSTYRDRYSSATESSNLVGGTPGFVNPGADDYRLSAASPAVDSGTPVNAPADDLDGTARPQGSGYDIGAYERVP
jgi:hypothetical protein